VTPTATDSLYHNQRQPVSSQSCGLHMAPVPTELQQALCILVTNVVSMSFSHHAIIELTLLMLLLLLPVLLQSGEPISFYWQFAGIGQERCFHNDVEIPDCASGVIVQVRRRKHSACSW
jgi:hypothetical protein